jgi:hypothetical protein
MNIKPRPQPAGGASSTTHTLTGNDGFIIMPNVAQHTTFRNGSCGMRG